MFSFQYILLILQTWLYYILYFIDTFQLSYGESVDYLTNPKPNNMEEEEEDDDDDGDKNGDGDSIAPQLLAP